MKRETPEVKSESTEDLISRRTTALLARIGTFDYLDVAFAGFALSVAEA